MRNAARFIRNALSRDEDRKFVAVSMLSHRLLPNYPLAWPKTDWARDEEFAAYLRRFDEAEGFNSHRKWMLGQLLRMTAAVEGDTAECGVYLGASSWLICAHNRQERPGAKHHLFDSFEGLNNPGAVDGDHWGEGDLAASAETVRRNLAPFEDQLVFHQGWIPDRFPDVEGQAFSFVHVDVDLYEPTRDSVAFFYDRLSDGGVLVCDDYGCTTCPGATKAVDEVLAGKPEQMISLDGGGGFFIKGQAVGPPVSPLP